MQILQATLTRSEMHNISTCSTHAVKCITCRHAAHTQWHATHTLWHFDMQHKLRHAGKTFHILFSQGGPADKHLARDRARSPESIFEPIDRPKHDMGYRWFLCWGMRSRSAWVVEEKRRYSALESTLAAAVDDDEHACLVWTFKWRLKKKIVVRASSTLRGHLLK